MKKQNYTNLCNVNNPPSGSVLVIGAGFGGIAVALRMRAKGFNVTLVDRLQSIGGRAQVFERGGFRHGLKRCDPCDRRCDYACKLISRSGGLQGPPAIFTFVVETKCP